MYLYCLIPINQKQLFTRNINNNGGYSEFLISMLNHLNVYSLLMLT